MKVRTVRLLSVLMSMSLLAGCTPSSTTSLPITVEGDFDVPESVLFDARADVYLVSNIAGDFFGKDGKGFVSRVSPSGKVLALKWIDGSKDGVTLNAPKGMAIVGDTLYVADVTAVRKFNRLTGEPLGSIDIAGSSFLNDLTAGADGTVYVSDTGLGFPAGEKDAIYKITSGDKVEPLIRGKELGQPNGLLAEKGGILAINWAGGEVFRVKEDGTRSALTKLPKAQLDGVVRDARGNYIVSSWEAAGLYQVSGDGTSHKLAVPDLKNPADLGFDSKRNRVLVPLFDDNKVLVLEVE